MSLDWVSHTGTVGQQKHFLWKLGPNCSEGDCLLPVWPIFDSGKALPFCQYRLSNPNTEFPFELQLLRVKIFPLWAEPEWRECQLPTLRLAFPSEEFIVCRNCSLMPLPGIPAPTRCGSVQFLESMLAAAAPSTVSSKNSCFSPVNWQTDKKWEHDRKFIIRSPFSHSRLTK